MKNKPAIEEPTRLAVVPAQLAPSGAPLFTRWPLHHAARRCVFRGRALELATEREIETLRKIQASWDKLEAQSATTTKPDLAAKRGAVLARYEADPTPENLKALQDPNLYPKEDVNDRARVARRAVNAAKEKACAASLHIFESIRVKASRIVAARKQEIIAIERKNAESVGIPFVPSETVLSFLTLERQFAQPIKKAPRAAPRFFLRDMIDL